MKIQKKFETYDRAWEFVHYLGKLLRSLGTQATIAIDGIKVDIETSDEVLESRIEEYFTDKDSKIDVNVSTKYEDVSIYCDGGSRGNPGPSASGFVIYDEEKNLIAEGGEFLGVTTNNQAEYHSLKDSLEKAVEMGVKKVLVHMDSQLVVRQILGQYRVKNRDLWPLYESALDLSKQFEAFSIVHVPREINKEADAMANKILDEATGVEPKN